MSDREVGIRYFNKKIPKTVSESRYQECLDRKTRAEAATARDDLTLAVDLLRRNLIWCKTNLSTDPMHEMTVWHQEELATSLAKMGNFNDALVHIGDAYDSRHAVSPDAEGTLSTLDQYAFILSGLQKYGLAARKYETVWKAQKATLGEDDPLTLNTGVELASCWFNHAMAGNNKMPNLRKARDLHQEILAAMERKATPDAIAIAMAREDLAGDHMELGNLKVALELANENLAELRRLKRRGGDIVTDEFIETERSSKSLLDDIQNRQMTKERELLEQQQRDAAERDQEKRQQEKRKREEQLEKQRIKEQQQLEQQQREQQQREQQQREQQLEEQRIKEKQAREKQIEEQRIWEQQQARDQQARDKELRQQELRQREEGLTQQLFDQTPPFHGDLPDWRVWEEPNAPPNNADEEWEQVSEALKESVESEKADQKRKELGEKRLSDALNESLLLEKLEKEEKEKAKKEQEKQVQMKRELEIEERARVRLENEQMKEQERKEEERRVQQMRELEKEQAKRRLEEAQQKRMERVNLARLQRDHEIRMHAKKIQELEAADKRKVQLKRQLDLDEQAKKRLDQLERFGRDLLRPSSAIVGKPLAEDPDTRQGKRRISMPDMTAKDAVPSNSASLNLGSSNHDNQDDKKPTPRIGTPTIRIDGPSIPQPSGNGQLEFPNASSTGSLEGKTTKQISRSVSTSKLARSAKLETPKQGDEDDQRPRRNSDPPSNRSASTTREPVRRTQPVQGGSPFDAIEDRFADRSVDGWFHDIDAINEYILAPFQRKARKRVKIAILDTGIDMNNSVFRDKAVRNRIKKRVDFLEKGGDAIDRHGHGTHCASLLNRIAPSADIYVGRVAVGFGQGVDANIVAEAIRRALGPKGEGDDADNWDVDILSLSLGFVGYNKAIKAALDETIGRGNGKLVLAAASNSGTRHNMAFPASAMGIIAVNSAKANGSPSNFNPRSTKDEKLLSILGEAVNSAWITTSPDEDTTSNPDATKRMTGTSVATPIAAGIAALVLEVAMIDIPDEEDTQRMLDEVLPWLRGYEGMMAVLMAKAAPTQGYLNIVPQRLLGPIWPEERRVNRIANRLRDILTEQFGDLREGP